MTVVALLALWPQELDGCDAGTWTASCTVSYVLLLSGLTLVIAGALTFLAYAIRKRRSGAPPGG
jgi:hypothetical protein